METPKFIPAVARNRPVSWRTIAHVLCAALTLTLIAGTAMFGSILHRGDIIAAQAKRIRELEEERSRNDYESMRQGWRLNALAEVQAAQLFAFDDSREAYTACLRHPNGQLFAWRELSGAHLLKPIQSLQVAGSNKAGYVFWYEERCELDDEAVVGIRATTPDGYDLQSWKLADDGHKRLSCPLASYQFEIEDSGDVQRALIAHCLDTGRSIEAATARSDSDR